MVRNVSQPTLTVFLPEPSIAVGTGVVVCPGGAFHFLMVDKEGTEVASWLTARGVAAFVSRCIRPGRQSLGRPSCTSMRKAATASA
ncbi:MAG TPA: hypothetical protein VGM69_27550 [Chloroflexota bacterium]